MNKTKKKSTVKVREGATRVVLNCGGQHENRWAAITSMSSI